VSSTAAVAVTAFSASAMLRKLVSSELRYAEGKSDYPATSLELLIDITLFNGLDFAGFQIIIEVPSVEIKVEFSNLQISIEVASFKGGDIVFLSIESLHR
jgi:hypothetical protein